MGFRLVSAAPTGGIREGCFCGERRLPRNLLCVDQWHNAVSGLGVDEVVNICTGCRLLGRLACVAKYHGFRVQSGGRGLRRMERSL